MYINFLTSLVILIAAFQLLLMIFAFPFALLDTWISMRSSRSTNRQSVVLKQVMLSVLLAAFVAIICTLFASLEGVEYRWVYAGTGFVATYLVLAGNAQFQRAHVNPLAYPDIQELQSDSAEGAVLGLPVGLVIYPLVYLWPRLCTFIPGASSFFSWSVNLAEWLGSFWLIRAIALLSAAGYIFNAGFLALFSAGILRSSIRTVLKALFSSQPGSQVTGAMINKMSSDNVQEILCVEDDDCTREFMVEELHEAFQDARIDVASDGAEALAKCLEHTPSILITNVAMPNMNGFELIKSLHGRKIELPIIVTSGFYSSNDLEKNGIQLGGHVRFIKKSSSFGEDLVREVDSIVKST